MYFESVRGAAVLTSELALRGKEMSRLVLPTGCSRFESAVNPSSAMGESSSAVHRNISTVAGNFRAVVGARRFNPRRSIHTRSLPINGSRSPALR